MEHYRCENGHIMADVVDPEKLKILNGWAAGLGNWRGEKPNGGGPWPKCPECGALPENAKAHAENMRLVI